MDLLDLKEGDCRYPSGDEMPFDFCGAPIVDGSYCAKHHKLCVSGKAAKPWQNLAGMIYATESTIAHIGQRQRNGDGFSTINRYEDKVSSIDEVFAASAECIGDGLLMDRVL